MTILDKIVEKRKERLSIKKKESAENSLQRILSPPRTFFNTKETTVIAECKKGSPSKGIFLEEYEPAYIAGQYERGGADAISVLTEPDFFFGSESHLHAVRESVSLPVLRKDFIFDPYQVVESWAMGADAILLIAAILSESQLNELVSCAGSLSLDILLEVHDEAELEVALNVPSAGIGINARNLRDFTIDLNATKRLCAGIPDGHLAVAESGLKSPQDGRAMYDAGFRGFLVGEYFITAQDREQTVKDFVAAVR